MPAKGHARDCFLQSLGSVRPALGGRRGRSWTPSCIATLLLDSPIGAFWLHLSASYNHILRHPALTVSCLSMRYLCRNQL